jgi:serine/threonine protein kinase
LKPANILMQPDDEAGEQTDRARTGPIGYLVPKITDFGLARRLHDKAGLPRTGFAVSNPEYMAPEHGAALGRTDQPADRGAR